MLANSICRQSMWGRMLNLLGFLLLVVFSTHTVSAQNFTTEGRLSSEGLPKNLSVREGAGSGSDGSQGSPAGGQSTSKATPLPVSSEVLLRWFGFKVYTATLRVPAAGIDPLDPSSARSLTLKYHRDFSAPDIIQAADELLQRSSDVNYASLTDRLAKLNRAYKDVVEGDSYTLHYEPDVGTTLLLNDVALVTVPGGDFARAYFGLWLRADSPISSYLREKLLRGVGVDPD